MSRLLIIFMTFCTCQLHAADYYWVGGGGSWSDVNHWRLGSPAGSIPSIVPSASDNVFFGAYSGFGTAAAEKTVRLDANGFCNNMTWESDVANDPVFVADNAAFTVEVWGNLILSPTTTYTLIFTFRGAAAATITSNGTVLGAFGLDINKPGSSVTVADSLVVPYNSSSSNTSFIYLTAGTFDIAGKKLWHRRFVSDNNNERTLEMANADLSFPYYYSFLGANKTLNAAGSMLYTGVYIFVDGGTYNRVINNANDYNNFGINNTTFKTIEFTRATSNSFAQLNNGNTVTDSLIFHGRGRIYTNNNVGYIYYGNVGSVTGTGNVARKVICTGNFNIDGDYTTTIDSLLLAPNHTSNFRGTLNIKNYLYVEGASCEAFTEIFGDSIAGSVNLDAGAVVDISNVILTGVKAYGANTPYAIEGIDGEGNLGFDITAPGTIGGTTLYWVGGPGDWNDRSHWSETSGGPGGACIPFINDNVVFNAGSSLAGGTITTSSSSFCRDMTWDASVGTAIFNESTTAKFSIYGSVVLNPSVTMNATLEFNGDDPASTITTNGSTNGELNWLISKKDAGGLTLTDDWSNANGNIDLVDGSLNMSGRNISIREFNSTETYTTKSLDINNSTIDISYRWAFTGLYKSMNAAGSHISSAYIFHVNGLDYPSVELSYAGANSAFNISSTNFGKLIFTSPVPTSMARIGGNNSIRRLEFAGAGAITNGGSSIDTMILAGSRNYSFAGITTINQYLQAQAMPCTGLTEMRGDPSGTLAFSSSAQADIDNIYMQNMTATGDITPIAFNGANAGGNTGWTINSTSGSALYWVGGAGDWNDNSHWSYTSGGAGGACIPTVYDDIYFDANSGFGTATAAKTVTINNGNAYCRNINWANSPNSPIWNKATSWNMECWGDSIIINPDATFNVNQLTLKGSNDTYMKGGAPAGSFSVHIDKPDGSLTLLDDYDNPVSNFILANGGFNAAGRTMRVRSIDNQGSANASSIDITNALVTAELSWRYNGNVAARSLSAAGSTIITPTFTAQGFDYHNVFVTGQANTSAVLGTTHIDSLVFTNTSLASAAGINGNDNTLGYVEYKGSGGMYGTANTIDTLVFFPGGIYTITAGTNNTITSEWFASGTPCRLTEIVSSSSTSNATITKLNEAPSFDYMRVRRITAAGTTPFVAYEHTIDQGNNLNWSIEPYDGVAPIHGLGADTAVRAEDFPIILNTDGFFGSPSSQYLWSDNTNADTLVVTEPGTYSVEVNFVDGCQVTDEIVVSLADPLPITLTRFTAQVQNCQSRLHWHVEDAVHFSHFVIEQSEDGRQYDEIGQVIHRQDKQDYSYIASTPGSGTLFYRLRLIDIDGTYTYSKVEMVNSTCINSEVSVSPTITENTVRVGLPAGYENARLYVINTAGQQLRPDIQGTGLSRTINLHNLPSATYILQIVNGKQVKSFKIFKN